MHRKCIVLLIQFTEMSAEDMQAEMLLDMEVGQETNAPPLAQPQLEATVTSPGTSQTTPEAVNQATGTSNSASAGNTSTSSSENIGLGPGTVDMGGRGRGGRGRGRGRQRRRGQ